jgi:LacI family transcriptional regulator
MRDIPKILLLIDTGTEYGRGLLRGIAKYSLLHGPWSFYWGEPFYRQAHKDQFSKTLRILKPQGIIIRVTNHLQEALVTALPVVYATDSKKEIDLAAINPKTAVYTCDWAATGRMAAEHLFERGFRRFAYCGYGNLAWSIERGKAFSNKVSKLGYSTHCYKQPGGKGVSSWGEELPKLAAWLAQLPKPIGLMACNDDRSKQLLEACKVADICVPDEIAIVGVDNDELICTLSTPQLSSINLNPDQTGYQISEMLDKLMSGQKLDNPVVVDRPTHIVTRQSTDVLAIDDSEVAKAVSFIRLNSKKMIQVSDVIDNIGISRRTLELRFRNILGHSVNTEIRKNKANLICQMLTMTNWSITRVAMMLGFNSADHIARFFRVEKQMTPTEYRKLYQAKNR